MSAWDRRGLGALWCGIAALKLLPSLLGAEPPAVEAGVLPDGVHVAAAVVELSLGVALAVGWRARTAATASLLLSALFATLWIVVVPLHSDCACLGAWVRVTPPLKLGLLTVLFGLSALAVYRRLPAEPSERRRSRPLP